MNPAIMICHLRQFAPSVDLSTAWFAIDWKRDVPESTVMADLVAAVMQRFWIVPFAVESDERCELHALCTNRGSLK